MIICANHVKPKCVESCQELSICIERDVFTVETVPEYDHDGSPMNLWFEHHGTPKSMMQHGPPAPNTVHNQWSTSPISGAGHKLTLPFTTNQPSHSIETFVGRSLTPLLDHAPREPNRNLALDHRSTSMSGHPRTKPWPCFGSPIHIYSGELTESSVRR